MHLSVCLSICRNSTFTTSSPLPLGQFQLEMAQNFLNIYFHFTGDLLARIHCFESLEIFLCVVIFTNINKSVVHQCKEMFNTPTADKWLN